MIIFILLTFTGNTSIFCQIDTTTIKIMVKMEIILEVLSWNNKKLDTTILQNFFEADLDMDIYKSSDFEDFVFVKVPVGSKGKRIGNITLLGGCESYIMAIELGNMAFYRIEGFWENDVANFFKKLKMLSYPNISSKRSFIKNYQIEDIDLRCLYKVKKGNDHCMKKCGEPILIY